MQGKTHQWRNARKWFSHHLFSTILIRPPFFCWWHIFYAPVVYWPTVLDCCRQPAGGSPKVFSGKFWSTLVVAMRPRGNLHHCTTRNSCEASESSVTLGTPVVDTIHQRVFFAYFSFGKKTTSLAFSVTCHTTAIPARPALNIDLTSGRDESYPLSLCNAMPPFRLGSTEMLLPVTSWITNSSSTCANDQSSLYFNLGHPAMDSWYRNLMKPFDLHPVVPCCTKPNIAAKHLAYLAQWARLLWSIMRCFKG